MDDAGGEGEPAFQEPREGPHTGPPALRPGDTTDHRPGVRLSHGAPSPWAWPLHSVCGWSCREPAHLPGAGWSSCSTPRPAALSEACLAPTAPAAFPGQRMMQTGRCTGTQGSLGCGTEARMDPLHPPAGATLGTEARMETLHPPAGATLGTQARMDPPPPTGVTLRTEARMDPRPPGPHSGQRPGWTPACRGHSRDRGPRMEPPPAGAMLGTEARMDPPSTRWGHARDRGPGWTPPPLPTRAMLGTEARMDPRPAGATLRTEARMDPRLPGPRLGQRPQDGTPTRQGHTQDRG